ncbi:hypothetical protein B6D29_02695 [Microgenomates bacterium UTCPR1]|nr:MAG: hypothetical protein B6D29_02695 [Microgenomates bacterium UTCPR1]
MKLNGLSNYVYFHPKKKTLYLKDTRIPLSFLINSFDDTGNVDTFLEHYPWLKNKKKMLISLLSKAVQAGFSIGDTR